MILKTQVKGGIILYALLIMSLFSLLLQFYLNRQLSLAQTNQANKDSLIAYSMAIWTRDKLHEESKALEDKATNLVEENILEDSKNQRDSEETSKTELGASGEPSKEEPEASEPPKLVDTDENRDGKSSQGVVNFEQGQVHYQLKGNDLEVKVQLLSGQGFDYVFHINGKKI